LLDDPGLITINEKYQAAQRIEKEHKQEHAKKNMSAFDRTHMEEAARQRRIFADQKRMVRLIDEALDIGTKLVNDEKCKDLEPGLKDGRAWAGKLRALHVKKEKAA